MLFWMTVLVTCLMFWASYRAQGWGYGLVMRWVRALNGLSAGQTIFYGLLMVAGLVMFGLFEAEGLRLFSIMAPELVIWFTLFDVALFADVMIVAVTLAASVKAGRIRDGVRAIPSRLWMRLGCSRRARGRSLPRPRRNKTSDPEPWSGVLAAC